MAEKTRLATFATPLSRDGPGLLLRDILRGDDPQISATLDIIVHVAPDVLLLTDFDHDGGLAALTAFAGALETRGHAMPHLFALPGNGGLATGLDLDGDGRTGEARDAQGYGRFAGDGGLALLSRYPIAAGAVEDFTPLLWRDLPGAELPRLNGAPFPSEEVQAVQRLSSTSHWAVPVELPGGRLTLLAWSATPPVFDGVEDLNGLRSRDELRLWRVWMDGALGRGPTGPFALIGNANLDPADGEGRREAMAALLADPRLMDPLPASAGGAAAADPSQTGDPALDNADWDGPGNLRVSYILPSAGLTVLEAGTFWPAPDDPERALIGADGQAAGPHRLVWVDLDF